MELSAIKGIGPTRLKTLRAMGISSLRDLLFDLPVRYEDRTVFSPCASREEGNILVKGVVVDKPGVNRFGGLTRVTASVSDETGKMPLVWYNQPWMAQQLPLNETIMLYGRLVIKNGRRALQNPAIVTEPSIQPVYAPVKGIPAKSFREMMRTALEQVEDCCPETLPHTLRMRYGLCELNFAIRNAHFPTDMNMLRLARRRLAFEQALMYQAAIGMLGRDEYDGVPMHIPADAGDSFWRTLGFAPTGAQRRVLEEIRIDLNGERAMSRLVQGDVGCGKTAIAFGAISMSVKTGFQAAMMAPTEILAEQHYQSAKAMLEPLGITCGLLTGSMKAKDKRSIYEQLENGSCQAVFGTHALITEKVKYHSLGLVITDEQHRFGVRQRSMLQEKGMEEGKKPHVLVMSATPIPRSLALILYGDLDVSIVDELPPGRQSVKTRIVPENKREDMYRFLRAQVSEGRQAYVVCPLVEESEAIDDVRSAKDTFDELQYGVLAGLKVALTWGNQPAQEKSETLRAFAAGETNVLVSTTVIEVGVNVPNATVMIIENAERFGLSQLHQLRGRVGRGGGESWCFMVADSNERLRIMAATNDGFEIARKDLELRGPGDLMGTRQSGEMFGRLLGDGDVRILEEAHRCMKELRDQPVFADEREAIEAHARMFYQEKLAQAALN